MTNPLPLPPDGELITPDILANLAKLPTKRRKAALRSLGRLEWERCAADVFYWIDERRHPTLGPYVYTLDQHPLHLCRLCNDQTTHFFNKRSDHLKLFHNVVTDDEDTLRGYFIELPTTRAFPYHLIDEYLRPIIQYWQREQFLFVEKSRDMFATWLMVTLYAWDTLFHAGRQNIFQSDDSMKTKELVERAWFIYNQQPKLLRDVAKVEYAAGPARSGHLRVPSINSEIIGFPQGPDQIRSLHPSGFFQDEAAFQVEAGDAFTAIKPAIQQGGRFTAISSSNPGWFFLVCNDRDQEE